MKASCEALTLVDQSPILAVIAIACTLAYYDAARAVEYWRATYGGATDCKIYKESGVDDNHDDIFAARRAELETQFHTLPMAGSGDYWRRIDAPAAGPELPLEVLARCLRERFAAGAIPDAYRIFEVIMRRTDTRVARRAWSVANQAKAGMKPQLQEDLRQECYLKLWQDLVNEGPTFLLENFEHKLGYIFDHVAQSLMLKAGEWRRPGVDKPTRIPQSEIESIDAVSGNEDDPPLIERIADDKAQAVSELVEFSEALAAVADLPKADRELIHAIFIEGLTQEEAASRLGVTARTIRNRLTRVMKQIRERYQGGEGDKGGDHV